MLNQVQNSTNHKRNLPLVLFILTYSLAYFKFFRPVGLDDDLLKAISYLFLFMGILYSQDKIFGGKNFEFTKILKNFCLFMFLSILPAQLFWGQNVIDTLISTLPYFTFLFYFFLIKTKPSLKNIENYVWIFLAVYLFCFYVALAIAPSKIFMGYGELNKAIDTERGLSRIRLTLIGAGPLYLGFFLSISKLKQKFSYKWFLITLFLFISVIMHLGRQSIMYCFILGVVYFINNFSVIKKGLILLVTSILMWILVNFVPVISKLIEKSQTDYANQVDGNEYVRFGAYKFYLFGVSPNIVAVLFGNGLYSLGKSDYGDYIDKFGRSQGYIPADVGFAAIYLYFGLIGIFFFILILYKAITLKVHPEANYAKYYLVFLYVGSFAGNTLLGSIPLFCVALYILLLSKKNKQIVQFKPIALQ